MGYEIIGTSVSEDKQKCYSVYKHSVAVDDVSAYTYGISASDVFSIYKVDDVVTDRETSLKLLKDVSLNSVSANRLNDYVLNYLSEL